MHSLIYNNIQKVVIEYYFNFTKAISKVATLYIDLVIVVVTFVMAPRIAGYYNVSYVFALQNYILQNPLHMFHLSGLQITVASI